MPIVLVGKQLDKGFAHHGKAPASLKKMGYAAVDTVELEEQCSLLEECEGDQSASCITEVAQRSHSTRDARKLHRLQRMRYSSPRCLRRNGWHFFCIFNVLLLLYFILPNLYIHTQKRYLPHPDWSSNTSVDIKDYIHAQQDTALIMPRDLCRNKTFLIIAVCSALNNFIERQTIRETWGNTTEFNYPVFAKLHKDFKGRYLSILDNRLQYYSDFLSGEGATLTARVRIVFIVGRSTYESHLGNETLIRLHNEADTYNDIIQDNFIDTYSNLTLKSVVALKHISKSCMNTCAYFLKCDDDTFVNVPNLLHFLLGGTIPLYNDTLDYHDRFSMVVMSSENRLNSTTGILQGHQFCNVPPISDFSSKWYMPYYMYQDDAYPKYLSGAGYVMSIDVVERLFDAALNTTLIYIEDIYITGQCANRAKIKRYHNPLFSFANSRHLCAFKGSITQHQVKEDNMLKAWRFVSNYTTYCPPPGRYLNHMRLRKHNNC